MPTWLALHTCMPMYNHHSLIIACHFDIPVHSIFYALYVFALLILSHLYVMSDNNVYNTITIYNICIKASSECSYYNSRVCHIV